MPFQLAAAESTDLFVGTEDTPRQVLRATLARTLVEPIGLTVHGDGVSGAAVVPSGVGVVVVEVGLDVPDVPAGTTLPVTVAAGDARLDTTVTVERPGFTLHMVPYVPYDPFWSHGGGAVTPPAWTGGTGRVGGGPGGWAADEPGDLAGEDADGAFGFVDAHVNLALRDLDYTFVLAQVDYLKPYLDTHPDRRADLRRLLAEGRLELVGGMYTDPSSNLTGVETTIRNLVYGMGYQRDVLGADPVTAWPLDAFGHDPQLPAYLAGAGLTGSAWARGPYHQWGPVQKNAGVARADAQAMQFPSEFEWISPSGRGVLTHYMPNHHAAGWWMDAAATLEEAELAVYAMYRILRPVAATRHLLLPVGAADAPPNTWVGEVHRSWNARYVWPRFVCGTPKTFLDGVRAELARTGRRPSPQTRDMNPVYTGKDVSYVDTKQAQHAVEVAATDAEKLATLAAVLGLGRYPDAALDKVWRILAYGSHHDAITGTASDQVYVDLVAGWREAHDLAAAVRDTAVDAIAGRIDTRGPRVAGAGAGAARDRRAVLVVNTLSYDRTDVVRVPGCPAGRLVDDDGEDVPAVHDRGTLLFQAAGVPALGWRTYHLLPGAAPAPAWRAVTGRRTIANERYQVSADPARGGALTSITDLATGRELLRGLGNELLLYDEYPAHPDFGEGPRNLAPRGPAVGSSHTPASSHREVGPLGERLVSTGSVDGLGYQQSVTLWAGSDRIDFRTRVTDFAGEDKLLRVRFPVDLPGARPVSGVAGAAVGRGFALPDVDAAEAPWTLDSSAQAWFGLGSTARVSLVDPRGRRLGDRALGVAEVVVGQLAAAASARELVVALARAGVTATTSGAHWSRYGWQSVDSNLPDFRIVLGGPDENAVARDLLANSDAEYTAEFNRQLAATGRVLLWIPAEKPLHEAWRPNADLRGVRAVSALLAVGPVDGLVEDLADAAVEAVALVAPAEPLTDATVALLTAGLPGFAVDPSGAMHLSLLRSCTGWPSGVWTDPPRRTTPDGSAFQLQRWTHEFGYALVSGEGDWRALGLPGRGQAYGTPLLSRLVAPGPGDLPSSRSFLRIEPAGEVLLSAFKPTGNPVASGSARASDPARGVSVRLAETTGLGRRATVSGDLRLGRPRRADLLERPADDGTEPEPSGDGSGFALDLTGFEVATVLATPATSSTPATSETPATSATPATPGTPATSAGGAVAEGGFLGPAAEPAQPAYARYWLHNRGVAPMGFQPITLAVSPRTLHPGGLGSVELEIVVASQLRDARHEGQVTLRVPDGWRADPAVRAYVLPPGGHVRFGASVVPAPGAVDGRYFVAARLEYAGLVVEDVATVVVAESGQLSAVPALPQVPTDAEGEEVPTIGPDTGLVVDVVKAEVVVRPGTRASIGVALTNRTRDEIRGELRLVSPWGTWESVPEAVRGFDLAGGSHTVVEFPVKVPADADPGHAWALAKVMWFGRCQYTPTVRLVVNR